ncbi:MAG: MotA/TolQ/ExbB proton channel family protein [Sandaracinus sp.]|nr:MotA/TolQ/ExbB proton channel family protein [Sandaracinus sp.]MCB9612373.1 MotA/TolQ/ExbB proton channel family protein [Sandaracinus sp.]MCB9624216.1 MotA/TolQ/ExbB proton channel family protein [Sandaracinus sp.]MCB9633504.1 MotA/TolQ/ExbB proton channel family protein [Sandaracinus sp.]
MEEIWHALLEGAPFSFINIGVLAFSLAIVAERLVFMLTKYRVNAPEFMAQVRKLVQAGNIDRAIKLCEAAPLPLLQVIKSGLTQVNRGEDAIIASMDEKLTEEIPNLEKRTPWLWTLANLATLTGLLGTVRGLIKAFKAVGEIDDPAQKQALLTGGISEAMWNTFLGLLIAVICMASHLLLNSMAKNHKHQMEAAAQKLENLLTLRPKG